MSEELGSIPRTRPGADSVFLGILAYGAEVPVEYMETVIDGVTRSNTPIGHVGINGTESLIPRGRNMMAADFLATDLGWLLFVDVDIAFTIDQIEKLLSHGREIVCGLCPKKTLKPEIVINGFPGEEPSPPDEHGLIRVRYAGTGFMLIHRNVFLKMIESYPEIAFTSDADIESKPMWDFFSVGVVEGRYLSEDWYFCERWNRLGGTVYADTTVQTRHMGRFYYPAPKAQIVDALNSYMRSESNVVLGRGGKADGGREFKQFLITGHPRSGTSYMAALAEACGLDIRHEQNDGADGICSWMFAVDTVSVPFFHGGLRGRKFYSFEKVIAVVREPLAMAASVAFTENKDPLSLYFRCDHTDVAPHDDPIRQAVQSILDWYEIISRQAPDVWIRVEDANRQFPEWLGVLVPEEVPPPTNVREHASLSWEQIRVASGEVLAARYATFAQEFGYEAEHEGAESWRKPVA